MSITQDKPTSVVATLAEAKLPRIQRATAQGTLPVSVYTGDDKAKLADGQLLTPNNAIDTSTGTIQLKATFANDDDALWPGEFVNARLRIDTLCNGVTVPLAAVQHGPNGMFVYTVKPDSTVQERDVQVADQDDNTAVISKGVNDGDTVALTGPPASSAVCSRNSLRIDDHHHFGSRFADASSPVKRISTAASTV